MDENEGLPLDGLLLVGHAPHGEIVPTATLWTRDGIAVEGAAIYDANREEWASVVEVKLGGDLTFNSSEDHEYTDAALTLVLGRTMAFQRRIVNQYDESLDDDDGGELVPIPVRA